MNQVRFKKCSHLPTVCYSDCFWKKQLFESVTNSLCHKFVMSVPTVVQNDSASCREEEEDASSLSPSDSASFDVTLDSAETPSSNPRSAREHYISVSNSKQVLFAIRHL